MWRLPKQWDHFSIIMSNIQYQRKVVLCFRMCLVKSLKRQQIIQIQTGTSTRRDSVQCKSLKICYKVKSVTLSLSLLSVVPPFVVYSACVGMRWAEQLSVFYFSTRVKLISHFVTFYTLAHLCHPPRPLGRHPSFFYSHSRRMPPEAHWNS